MLIITLTSLRSNIYDNCHEMADKLDSMGRSMRWAKQQMRKQLGGGGVRLPL